MDVDATEVSKGPRPVEIEVVRGALTRLSLLAQTLSGAHQGDAERYASNFAEALSSALPEGAAPVVLVIRDQAVFYAGSEVSGNDLVIRSIVGRLATEGLSTITVLPGVSREELFELSHLLAKLGESSEAVDAVSRLGAKAWALNLRHVHFDTEATSVVTEADDRVRPNELIQRLTIQLGIGEDTLEPHAFMELGAMLGGLRALSDAPRAGGVERPRTGSVWGRALRDVRNDTDVSNLHLTLLVTESLRAAPDAATCTALAESWLERVRECFLRGDPERAGTMLRPVLLCADADYRPAGFDPTPVRVATAKLSGAPIRTAITEGIAQHPQTDDWVGPLFTLGQAATADTVGALAQVGHKLTSGPVREALGDGIASAIQRHGNVQLRDLLATASDRALPVLLHAARRFEDPTLIEPLLARMRHESALVREVALFALRAQQSPRIRAAARDAVNDSARPVRLEALRYLSVYRDMDGAPVVEERLRTVKPDDADIDEMRALAIAWLHTSRGEALPDLEALAAKPVERGHPDVPAACVGALARAGGAGREALDRLGRNHPHLRPLLRDHTAPRGPERRP